MAEINTIYIIKENQKHPKLAGNLCLLSKYVNDKEVKVRLLMSTYAARLLIDERSTTLEDSGIMPEVSLLIYDIMPLPVFEGGMMPHEDLKNCKVEDVVPIGALQKIQDFLSKIYTAYPMLKDSIDDKILRPFVGRLLSNGKDFVLPNGFLQEFLVWDESGLLDNFVAWSRGEEKELVLESSPTNIPRMDIPFTGAVYVSSQFQQAPRHVAQVVMHYSCIKPSKDLEGMSSWKVKDSLGELTVGMLDGEYELSREVLQNAIDYLCFLVKGELAKFGYPMDGYVDVKAKNSPKEQKRTKHKKKNS